MSNYSYIVDHSERYGTLITLRYSELGRPDFRTITVAADLGGNMFRFMAGGYELLGHDLESLYHSRFTGSPILYPTPNRVRNSRYTFEGKDVHQVKKGVERNIHGLVYDEAWQYAEPVCTEDGVSVTVWFDFVPGTDCYASFPFEHRISVCYTLTKDYVELKYTVDNKSGERLPYGFAIHPFWNKDMSADGTWVQTFANSYCERTPDILPTGNILPVDGTVFDLRKPVKIQDLDIDDVFADFSEFRSVIDYRNQGLKLEITASKEFEHLVICTAPKNIFFCLENQTCMTDAHNLYNRGLKKESGLLVVEPDEQGSGYIRFHVEQ